MREVSIAIEALQWSYDYFLHRDMMNAQVHCAPLRKSPITERIHGALEELRRVSSGADKPNPAAKGE